MTRNHYGSGTATYLGCRTSDAMLREILTDVIKGAGLWGPEQETEFPVIIKKGENDYGKNIVYYLNYSPEVQKLRYRGSRAEVLLTGDKVEDGEDITIEPWNLVVLER